MKQYSILLSWILICLLSYTAAQQDVRSRNHESATLPFIQFKASEKQKFGFDFFQHNEWVNYYELWENSVNKHYYISHKSVGEYETDEVEALFINRFALINRDSVYFMIEDSPIKVRHRFKNDSTAVLSLPAMNTNYTLRAVYGEEDLGRLYVTVYPVQQKQIIFIPLIEDVPDMLALEKYLNGVYAQVNMRFDIKIEPLFETDEFNRTTVFDNPSASYDHYTSQMRSLRDAYFDKHPSTSKKSYYFFIVPEFVNENVQGFMAKNKALGFVKYMNDSTFHIQTARNLARGIGILQSSWLENGPDRETTTNLMDELGGTSLTHFQWERLVNSANSYSLYDADEDVRTNNGMIAYYFWEEDENGNLLFEPGNLLRSIKRPYKKNYVSYHLNIEDYFFKPLFAIGKYFVCIWHFILLALLWFIMWVLQRKIRYRLRANLSISRIWMIVTNTAILLVTVLVSVIVFFLVNKQLEKHEITSGLIVGLTGQSYADANRSILYNKNLKRTFEEEMGSEILFKRGENWYMKRRKKVLYFELKKDSTNQWASCRFKSDSDTLIVVTQQYRKNAENHYFVFNYMDENGQYDHQVVFNHAGTNITARLQIEEDPVKNILVFVNGYRPTSIGHTFEENFKDIQRNGLEFPNSNNLIFNFDRYDYWRPWQEIDLRIQKRLNPSETFYADGHFSVSTSNYRSLLNFTNLSNKYPKRCVDPENHTCAYTNTGGSRWFGSSQKKTASLLPLNANKSGFYLRRENGRIAGNNLLQLLNEVPNRSDNDTLFIVAHSMGYAYALGMIESMRGRINFGEFYIIAPENAESGLVDRTEWQQIWQYGCNHAELAPIAPCMLDGVAPQSKAKGLSDSQRVYIPQTYYRRHGFFDSHFIGFYTWIFDIPDGKPGYMGQR